MKSIVPVAPSVTTTSLSDELWDSLAEGLAKSSNTASGEQIVTAVLVVGERLAELLGDVDFTRVLLTMAALRGEGTPADEHTAVTELRERFAARRKADAADAAALADATARLN